MHYVTGQSPAAQRPYPCAPREARACRKAVGGCIGVARREKIEMGDRGGGRQGKEQLYRVRKTVIGAEYSGAEGIVAFQDSLASRIRN